MTALQVTAITTRQGRGYHGCDKKGDMGTLLYIIAKRVDTTLITFWRCTTALITSTMGGGCTRDVYIIFIYNPLRKVSQEASKIA